MNDDPNTKEEIKEFEIIDISEINETDMGTITPEMFERIINNPSEASACIQYLLEQLARKKTQIEFLDGCIERAQDVEEKSSELIDKLMDLYIFQPWWKRVLHSIFTTRILIKI